VAAQELKYREPPHTEPSVQTPKELAPYRPMGTATTPPWHSAYMAGTFDIGGTIFIVATTSSIVT
jgi:hypothetical protein